MASEETENGLENYLIITFPQNISYKSELITLTIYSINLTRL